MQSLLGKFSPYVRNLEEQVEALKVEREALLNRLLHAYSGYELRQPVPSYADATANAPHPPQGEEVLGRGTRSSIDLMTEYEDACLQAADNIADVTVKAAREKVERENAEDAAEYERNMINARRAAAAEAGHTN